MGLGLAKGRLNLESTLGLAVPMILEWILAADLQDPTDGSRPVRTLTVQGPAGREEPLLLPSSLAAVARLLGGAGERSKVCWCCAGRVEMH